MNELPKQNKQPLLMTYQEWYKTVVPYCANKKPLLDGIKDIWNTAIPQPQKVKGHTVKMILPKHIEDFVRLCAKENG